MYQEDGSCIEMSVPAESLSEKSIVGCESKSSE